jgi:hypothetical protein
VQDHNKERLKFVNAAGWSGAAAASPSWRAGSNRRFLSSDIQQPSIRYRGAAACLRTPRLRVSDKLLALAH